MPGDDSVVPGFAYLEVASFAHTRLNMCQRLLSAFWICPERLLWAKRHRKSASEALLWWASQETQLQRGPVLRSHSLMVRRL